MKHNEEKIEEILPKEVRFDEIAREPVIEAMKAYGEHIRKETIEECKSILSNLEIIDTLSDIEHQRWSKWQKYIHSKILPSEHNTIMLIGTDSIERWNRQINTKYKDLSEIEKESDREQVRMYLPVFLQALNELKTYENN